MESLESDVVELIERNPDRRIRCSSVKAELKKIHEDESYRQKLKKLKLRKEVKRWKRVVWKEGEKRGPDFLKLACAMFVDDNDKLGRLSNLRTGPVAIKCTYREKSEGLSQISIATGEVIYVFDCVKLNASDVAERLKSLLNGKNTLIIFFAAAENAIALQKIGFPTLCECMDIQLAFESLHGKRNVDFSTALDFLNVKESLKFQSVPEDEGVTFVRLLLQVGIQLKESLEEKGRLRVVKIASAIRARNASNIPSGTLPFSFDKTNHRIISAELLQASQDNINEWNPIVPSVHDESSVLINMLPPEYKAALENLAPNQRMVDIVLDIGKHAYAWISYADREPEREFIGAEVDEETIASVVERVGVFGPDNRAGIKKQLHRISAVRNKAKEIIGLTLRVGRHVKENADMIHDLLFADQTKSILFLGKPGSGKTTIVREVARELAATRNVIIVDTSNEIAGDGDVPHDCVGLARRMMVVGGLEQQANTMIECVQNHTPHVMVIDEIGRPTEVEAARTCKERGVRLIASAHGDLRGLIKNPRLKGLIGGVNSVTLGDAAAREAQRRRNHDADGAAAVQKVVPERAGAPVFDIIVELDPSSLHEWRIVLDAGRAVDAVLRGDRYSAQVRVRNPTTGDMFTSDVYA